MNSPTPLERTIDQVLTKEESDLLSELNKTYLESISNIEKSKSQLEEEYRNIISQAEKKAENLKRQVVGSSKLSARNGELVLIEQAVNEIFEKAKGKFSSSSESSNYQNLLDKMVEKGIPNIGTSDIIIECLKKDVDSFKKHVELFNQKSDKKIKVQGTLKNSLGGFKIKSADGTVTLDNTIDSRIESLKPLIRKHIAEILKGVVE